MQEGLEEQQPVPPDESPGGPIFAELIREALGEERARKDSLERRGVSMVTASAFLSAFILSLLTFNFRNIDKLPRFETVLVWVALGGFVLAAALGLAVNWAIGYSEPTLDYLTKINEEARWSVTQRKAAHRVNESRILTIRSYRGINKAKARLLTAALVGEMVGILSLAVLIVTLIL